MNADDDPEAITDDEVSNISFVLFMAWAGLLTTRERRLAISQAREACRRIQYETNAYRSARAALYGGEAELTRLRNRVFDLERAVIALRDR